MLETWVLTSFNFQCPRAKRQKSFILLQKKDSVHYHLSSRRCYCHPRACMDSKKTNSFKYLNIRDMQNVKHRNSPI